MLREGLDGLSRLLRNRRPGPAGKKRRPQEEEEEEMLWANGISHILQISSGALVFPLCPTLCALLHAFYPVVGILAPFTDKKKGERRKAFPLAAAERTGRTAGFSREGTERGSPDPGKCPRRPSLLPAGDDGAADRPLESGKLPPGPPPSRRESRTPPKPPGTSSPPPGRSASSPGAAIRLYYEHSISGTLS